MQRYEFIFNYASIWAIIFCWLRIINIYQGSKDKGSILENLHRRFRIISLRLSAVSRSGKLHPNEGCYGNAAQDPEQLVISVRVNPWIDLVRHLLQGSGPVYLKTKKHPQYCRCNFQYCQFALLDFLHRLIYASVFIVIDIVYVLSPAGHIVIEV